jgi:outer membrane murein-binding lipoprotein Lpp
MLRIGAVVALSALALGLAGCEGRARTDAAASAERLLKAVETGDRVAFEAEIDRQAVREDVRRQMVEWAREQGLEVEGGPSEFALDRMIGPEAFRVVHAADGKPLKERMKIEDGKVCLPSEEGAERCLLTFGKSEKRWRLVGMQAMGLTIEVAQADGQAGD